MLRVDLAAAQHRLKPQLGVKFLYNYGLRDSGHSFIHSQAPMCNARQREAPPPHTHTKGRDPGDGWWLCSETAKVQCQLMEAGRCGYVVGKINGS